MRKTKMSERVEQLNKSLFMTDSSLIQPLLNIK